MGVTLTWLGHGSWLLHTGKHSLLVDPFLDDSPSAPVKSDQVQADYILVSHGHADHISDAAKIAHRTHATVISVKSKLPRVARYGRVLDATRPSTAASQTSPP